MKNRMLLVIIQLAILLLPLSTAAQAQNGACSSPAVKITEENRRFSVLVPKSSGLGRHDWTYDDIGCAIRARNEECASRQSMFDGAALAHDYASGAQLPADTLYFVLKTDIRTPRGSGIVAFGDKAEAERFSLGHGTGKVVKWYELVDTPY